MEIIPRFSCVSCRAVVEVGFIQSFLGGQRSHCPYTNSLKSGAVSNMILGYSSLKMAMISIVFLLSWQDRDFAKAALCSLRN